MAGRRGRAWVKASLEAATPNDDHQHHDVNVDPDPVDRVPVLFAQLVGPLLLIEQRPEVLGLRNQVHLIRILAFDGVVVPCEALDRKVEVRPLGRLFSREGVLDGVVE